MKIEEEIKQSSFQSIHHKAIVNLLYTANRIQNRQQEFLRPHGITAQQFNILKILQGRHPKGFSSSEIKSRMIDKNSDVSRLLDRLSLKDFISRSTRPSDRRATNIRITRLGLDLLESLDNDLDAVSITLLLSEDEAGQLNDLLDKSRG